MLVDTLRQVAGMRLTDIDGEVTTLELLPPATPDQIRALEARLPCALPDEMRDALAVSTGFANGPLESFSLLDLEGFGLDEVFPHAYSIAHDGYGNYWVLDVLPDTTALGPVFYACHDPPVIAYQSPSMEAFIRDLVAEPPDGPKSAINHVHETVVHHLWRDHSSLLTQTDALASPDSALREFAAGLEAGALIADLRTPKSGDGFAWGMHGPRTEIRRFGTTRLWAITQPPKKPGIFARLFGS